MKKTAFVIALLLLLSNLIIIAGAGDVETSGSSGQRYVYGHYERVKNNEGYYDFDEVNPNCLHYGWELGNFVVSGFTDKVEYSDGSFVFLKNPDDKVKIGFELFQDIDKLNGKDYIIAEDKKGFDKVFETEPGNMGRGTLFVAYKNSEGKIDKSVSYTDYLAANAKKGAEVEIEAFEEGDYYIVLDYAIRNDSSGILGMFKTTEYYTMEFSFSVRNGNCMVYPFDITTGNELSSGDIVSDGFKIDLAKSKYLEVTVKREVLNGTHLDTRYNAIAAEGDVYTEEGYYTITAYNFYTGVYTDKYIFVGDSNKLTDYAEVDNSLYAYFDAISKPIKEDTTATLSKDNNTVIVEDGNIDLDGYLIDNEMSVLISLILGAVIIALIVLIVALIVLATKNRKLKKTVITLKAKEEIKTSGEE